MALFNRKKKVPVDSLQSRALSALEENAVKLKQTALNNESFSVAGSYAGKPKKEHQEAMKQFLASRKAIAVYPDVAWSGAVYLFPNSDGTVFVAADDVIIDQLSSDGARAFLETTTTPGPVWCEIQLIGKAPYTRMHVSLRTQKPTPKG